MSIKHYVMAAMAVLALAGCQTGSGNSADDSGSSSRTDYMATVKDKMKAMDGKIDDLADKSSRLKDDAKAQAQDALAALRRERVVLGEKYDQLMKSSQGAWEDAKASFGNTWDQMQSSITTARAKFN